MLWGWDATASDQSVNVTDEAIQTADEDPTEPEVLTSTTTYNFNVAMYREFLNSLSELQIAANQKLFIKIGVKIFDDSNEDNTVELANGISNYFEITVPESASWSLLAMSTSALLLSSLLF